MSEDLTPDLARMREVAEKAPNLIFATDQFAKTFSPPAILSLLDRIAELEGERDVAYESQRRDARYRGEAERQAEDAEAQVSALAARVQQLEADLIKHKELLLEWVALKELLGADSYDGIEPRYIETLDALAARSRDPWTDATADLVASGGLPEARALAALQAQVDGLREAAGRIDMLLDDLFLNAKVEGLRGCDPSLRSRLASAFAEFRSAHSQQGGLG